MAPSAEDFERLGPPRKGEWRSIFHEEEQTFDAYAAARPKRADALRLQPLGTRRATAPLFALMRDYAQAFFGLDAIVLDPRPMFDKPHVPTRDQHNSSMILDELADAVPAGAEIVLGVTELDLFARGKPYVFGESRAERRTGICSLARLAAPDAALFERRALKLVSHEAGHLLSIAHCTTHRCLMQGSNTLEESDGQPLHLCDKDQRKLAFATGVDPVRRARELKAFYEARGWLEEAHRIARTT